MCAQRRCPAAWRQHWRPPGACPSLPTTGLLLSQGVLLVMNGLAILNNERFLEKCECRRPLFGGEQGCPWFGRRVALSIDAPFWHTQMAGASRSLVTTPWDHRRMR